jgi:oligosaccharide repeat unit polymerase
MRPLDVAFGLLLLLTLLNYFAHRSVLYPPFIFSAMWLLVMGVDCLRLIEVDTVHSNTLVIVVAGATAFSIGGWIAGVTSRKVLRVHLFPPMPRSNSRFVRNLLLIILLCGLPVLFYQILQLSKGASGFGVLMRARQAQVEAAQNGEPVHSLVLDYFVMIATMASLIFATEKRDRQFWIVTAIAFVGCVLSTGRTSLLLLIAGLSAIHLLQKRQESFLAALRLLRWPIILFVSLYIGLIFADKNTRGMTGGTSGIVTYFVLSYIVGPLSAFDTVVQNPAYFEAGTNHTFEFPLKLADALHLTTYTAPPKLDHFVMVPFPTNVYTVFKFYFLDLGATGAVVLFLFIGLVHSLLYLKAREGGRFSTFLFAFSLYSVLMVIFDDAYYTTGVFLRLFAFGFLYFILVSTPLSLPAGQRGASRISRA